MKAMRERQQEARLVMREWVARFLADNPCVDCGESDLRCLEFDHRPGEGKRNEVAVMLAQPASFTSILAEIAKCDVVCSNCHRRRTSERAGFWKESVQKDVELARSAAVTDRLARLFPTASTAYWRSAIAPTTAVTV